MRTRNHRQALAPSIASLMLALCVPAGHAEVVNVSPEIRDWLGSTKGNQPLPANLTTNALRLIEERSKSKDSRAASRISTVLLGLATGVTKGQAPAPLADSYGIRFKGGRVGVIVHTTRGARTSEAAAAVTRLGGRVRSIEGSDIYADIDAARIPSLEQIKDIYSIEPDWLIRPQQHAGGEINGEGLLAMRAQALHAMGLRGRGVRVGIIDMGFERYEELQQAGVLPAPIAAQAFGDSTEVFTEGPHGTACAEIIHSVAPEATLVLARFDGSNASAMEAMRWMAAQKVDVISASWGSSWNELDGNSPVDQLVDELVQTQRIVWVNAAGNEADEHWGGTTADRNGNTLIDVPASTGPTDMFEVLAGPRGFRIIVNWNDWGRFRRRAPTSLDIDAYLLAANPQTGAVEVIGTSADSQRNGRRPNEVIIARPGSLPEGARLFLTLHRASGTDTVPVHVFVQGDVQLRPLEPRGSVGSPGTARESLTAGAVDVRSGEIARYSSHGPTDDGRLKPEVTAPAGGRSLAYSSAGQADNRFNGTSAAAPHVAAFAALLKQSDTSLSGAALRDRAVRAVRPLGTPIPNVAYGYGHIDGERASSSVPAPPPVAAPAPPTTPTPAPTPPAPPAAPSPPAAPTPPAAPPQEPAPPQRTVDDVIDDLLRDQKPPQP